MSCKLTLPSKRTHGVSSSPRSITEGKNNNLGLARGEHSSAWTTISDQADHHGNVNTSPPPPTHINTLPAETSLARTESKNYTLCEASKIAHRDKQSFDGLAATLQLPVKLCLHPETFPTQVGTWQVTGSPEGWGQGHGHEVGVEPCLQSLGRRHKRLAGTHRVSK